MESYEAVVIGSGFGGTILSLTLAKYFDETYKDKKVCILERGKWWLSHEITNFNSNNHTRIELKPDNTISFSGTVDVKLNNTTPWNGTNVNVMISKGKTISIVLDNKATGDHFQGQPIYGIVDSIKDASGKEILSQEHQIITRLQQ